MARESGGTLRKGAGAGNLVEVGSWALAKSSDTGRGGGFSQANVVITQRLGFTRQK